MENETQNQQVNQTPEATTPSLSPTAKSKLPFILGGVLLLLVVAIGAYYLGSQQNKPNKTAMEVKPSQLPTQQSTSIPTTSADNTASNEFKLRYYNPNDIFFDKEKYPIEITDVQDSSLTQMSCTSNYTGYGKDYTSYDESTRKSNPLTDKTLLSDIQMLNKQYNGKTVSEILACVPQQGKRIVLYSLGPCGGGCSGIPYVGVEDSTGIHQVSQIQNNMAYFGCRQPLQLTKTNNFYFKCGGGDGPGASASIYNLSLNNLTVTKVKECTAGIDEAGKQYSKCE